jgi:hypothetical protein
MNTEPLFPRPLNSRELAWLDYLLPLDRPGYAMLRRQLDGLLVLGEGRWGRGDLVIGNPAAEIDLTAPMLPVAAYGECDIRTSDGSQQRIILSLHQPDDEGSIEFQQTTLSGVPVPDEFTEANRWSYSYWLPGMPCPATGASVREIPLSGGGDLLLVLAIGKRVVWVFDAVSMTNALVPVTNFYNELMLIKGVRDPAIGLDHRRLFDAMDEFSDAELCEAFKRYNNVYRKVAPERLIPVSEDGGTAQRRTLGERIRGMFGGRD